MKFGFIKSKLDGTELKYSAPNGINLPESYTYRGFLSPIIDQGNRNICVPCSLSTYLNWEYNSKNKKTGQDNKIDLDEIFSSRIDKKSDLGMTFKEALCFLNHVGVNSDLGRLKISKYSMVSSYLLLKYALLMNGPCIGGLPVYNSYQEDFWNGNAFEGGHAVSIVGYNNDGFVIRNSWGLSYGDSGYSVISYDDFNKFYEIWTIIC